MLIVSRRSKALIFLAPVLLIALSCALELRLPPGPPRFSPEGIWLADAAEGRPAVVLAIQAGRVDGRDVLRFREFQLQLWDRPLSGKTAAITWRFGTATTSAEEVLLTQEEYRSLRQPHASEPKAVVWPAEGYGPVRVERKLDKISTIRLLRFGVDGRTLSGDELTFTRVGSDAKAVPAGVVLFVDVVEKRALIVAPFEEPPEAVAVAPGAKPLALLLHDAERFTVAYDGQVRVGQAVYAANAPPGKAAGVSKPLTKAEVLERIRRGQKVSREDLIRVLGPEGGKGGR